MTKTTTPAEWISLLVENAGKLREAGVTRIKLGNCEVEIAPHVEPLRLAKEEPEPADPLDDPATFGFSRGTQMPGFPPREDD